MTQTRKYMLVSLAGVCAALLIGNPSLAATTGVDGDLAQADMDGSSYFTQNADGSVSITFGVRPGGPLSSYAAASAEADVSSADGAFAGNYLAAGIQGVTLRIKSNGTVPGGARIVLKARSGRTWVNRNVVVSGTADEWILNYLPMTVAAGWDRAELPGVDKGQLLAEDLQDVASIGVRLSAGGSSSETYTVDDFALVGDGFLTPLQQSLWNSLGYVPSENDLDAMAAADADSDNASDLDELLAGTDAEDATDVLAVEIVSVDDEGVTLRWRGTGDKQYTVYKTDAVGQGFDAVDAGDLSGAQVAAQAGRSYVVQKDMGATGQGPFFYKVALVVE